MQCNIKRIESGAVKPRSSTIKIISEPLGLDFFENSNQNSSLKNRTFFWYLKDLFNFKTNAMKKISILSVFILITTFLCLSMFNIGAQSKNSEKNQKAVLKNQDHEIGFSNKYDAFEVDGNFVWTLKNNKHGLMNLDGKIIIPNEYDAFEVDGNFVAVIKNNKRGLMNLDGKTIIPCQYDTIKFEDGVAIVSKNGKTKRIQI